MDWIYIFGYARNLQLKDLPAWLYMRKMSMYIFYIHPWFFYLTYLLLDKGKYTIVHMSSMSRFVVCMIFSFAFGQAVITLSKQERFRFLRYLS